MNEAIGIDQMEDVIKSKNFVNSFLSLLSFSLLDEEEDPSSDDDGFLFFFENRRNILWKLSQFGCKCMEEKMRAMRVGKGEKRVVRTLGRKTTTFKFILFFSMKKFSS